MTKLTPDRHRRVRDMAEAQIRATGSPDSLEALTPAEIRAALHELHVHQIELEAQNEELRRAQQELEATRARYFDLYDLAPVGYCTISAKGLLLQANLTAATLLGMARKKLIHQPVIRFVLQADRGLYFKHHHDLIETGQSQFCELRLTKGDGTTCWVHLVSTLAQDDQGAPEHRVMIVDVSQRKQMEASLQAKNAELADAKNLADNANQAKSDFLSSMSHELRTPLNSILGFAQLLEAGTPIPTVSQQARIGQILKAGWYLLELVNEILDLSVIESGRAPLVMEPVAVAEVMQECQSMVDHLAQSSEIATHYPAFDAPVWVQADHLHLKQVLINLLTNAIKYNRSGGSVVVTCSEVPSGRIRISVRDTGQGLSAAKLSELFQAFNRLGQEAGAIKGTGIGLVVSKKLIELMGGNIGVNSTVGVGSVFWIELHAAAAPKPAMPATAFADSSGLTQNTMDCPEEVEVQQCTLLYVEDNLANLELVEELLSARTDIRLLTAKDAPSGIALARTQQPDVIVMDINLPGMSGLEALKLLQQDPLTRHIVVLALSANAMHGDLARGLAAGFFRYLTKPIKIAEFMQVLDLALERASTNANAHDTLR